MFGKSTSVQIVDNLIRSIFDNFSDRWLDMANPSYGNDLVELMEILGDPESRPRHMHKIFGQDLICLAEAFVDARVLKKDLQRLEENDEDN